MEKVVMRCPLCRRVYSEDYKYCIYCGALLKPESTVELENLKG